MTEDQTHQRLVLAAAAELETALLQVSGEAFRPVDVIRKALSDAGATVRVAVEFPSAGNPCIVVTAIKPNGDSQDLVHVTAEPLRAN